ncbi:hypothetical protein CRUP_005494 [Coryphaenoides rupestris]|nr:hypothetical protein CRUP_005494 [Coryphaenoides rupestris]
MMIQQAHFLRPATQTHLLCIRPTLDTERERSRQGFLMALSWGPRGLRFTEPREDRTQQRGQNRQQDAGKSDDTSQPRGEFTVHDDDDDDDDEREREQEGKRRAGGG